MRSLLCAALSKPERHDVISVVERARSRTLIAAASAAAMTLMLVPTAASAQDAETPDARGLDGACPPPDDAAVDDAAELPDATGVHAEAIRCAADYGLVQGFEDGTYGPGVDVTRGQMATFIRNWTETALGAELTVPAEPAFPDATGVHGDAISALAEAGIVAGLEDGTYGTGATVNRAQMSRFILNALDFADNPQAVGTVRAASETEFFADVVGTFFQADIQALASVGIVQGTGDGQYSPAGAVNRGQLASFLMRSADFMEREQRWQPTASIETFTVMLSGENEVAVDEDTGEVTFGVGEEGATGEAILTVDAFTGTLDWEVEFSGVTGPFDGAPGLHIHEGALDENGGIVAFLADGDDLEGAEDGFLNGSFAEAQVDAEVDFRLADLLFESESYYVNLHSNDFPPGAVRGQLPDGGQDLIPSIVTFQATLIGANEIEVDDEGNVTDTGVGEIGASADATVTVDALRGEITWEIDFSDVTGPFEEAPGFHIHAGAADENGPVVVFLASGDELEAAEGQMLSGVFTESDLDEESELDFRDLLDTPENFYLNLHSEDFPDGAVRAQLG